MHLLLLLILLNNISGSSISSNCILKLENNLIFKKKNNIENEGVYTGASLFCLVCGLVRGSWVSPLGLDGQYTVT